MSKSTIVNPRTVQHFFVCPLRLFSPSVRVKVAAHTVQFSLSPSALINSQGPSSPLNFSSSNRRFLPISRRDSSLYGKPTTGCLPRLMTFSAAVNWTSRKPDHPWVLHGRELLLWLHGANLCGFPVNLLECIFPPSQCGQSTFLVNLKTPSHLPFRYQDVSNDQKSTTCKFLSYGGFVFSLSATQRPD